MDEKNLEENKSDLNSHDIAQANELEKKSIPFKNPQATMFTSAGWQELGYSAGDRVITGKILRTQNPKGKILMVGGVHGNETEGIVFMQYFCGEFACNNMSIFDYDIFLIPVLNPDGLMGFKRHNDNGVDLNRNMPTKDWQGGKKGEKYYGGESAGSEPENQVLVKVLDSFKPQYIISFHSWKPMANVNGPAHGFAQYISQKNNMEVTEDVGYPTPGSLGTYAGVERNIPTITLEFERGNPLESYYPTHRDAIIHSFDYLDIFLTQTC